jgi:hypothetical protein
MSSGGRHLRLESMAVLEALGRRICGGGCRIEGAVVVSSTRSPCSRQGCCLQPGAVVSMLRPWHGRRRCRIEGAAVVSSTRSPCSRRGCCLQPGSVVSKPRLWHSKRRCRTEGAVVVSSTRSPCSRRGCRLESDHRLRALTVERRAGVVSV